MASGRSIEVKVGLLILSALALLAVFILVMGGINFQPTYELLVGFDNPGGLQGGAPVKIAGVKVGKVKGMEFFGGRQPLKDGKRAPLVRARIAVEERYRDNIHDNAIFYITTQGVLGEQFLAVDPGSSDRPILQDGAVIRGLDPPRLDRLIAESYDLLHTTVTALREHKGEIAGVFDGLGKTLKGTGEFMHRNQDRLDRIAINVETMSDEGAITIKEARLKFVENPRIDRILVHVDRLTAASAKDVPLLLRDGREALGGVKRLVNTVGTKEQVSKINRALDNVAAAAGAAKKVADDAQSISKHIRRGRGTVGAMVMDEQLFDDLQELARDLKHNPWKFFWKE